ncbi:TetR/AcrR family transcriptional regulator [Bifidobacterium stellenboschense]|uniref:TetR family transcriptional regulator n=1 Tax=Bifidobacterium stellenboschense TaxID=762211 RepID=A0A087DPS8_9BIFI|nr:TetR family transcriptional regulator [Bifidobacterium stellenboschense]KFI97528.1 TetR family transcriptional regulator [Bifidobacterium stellenboschense]
MGESARRFDPERKDRIIEACLDVIAAKGVAGASHRVIAAAANVPLGSMTYHFDGMADLLHQAFDRYADRCIASFASRMDEATDEAGACEAVARHIETDLVSTQRDLVINMELYTIAARDPAYRDITERWMAASRAQLERFFDAPTAAILDSLIEGLTLHRALGDGTLDVAAIRQAIRRAVPK